MELFLIRHAKSSWKQQGMSDHQRPLNSKGKGDIPVMARLLKDCGSAPTAFIYSDARRATDTAMGIAAELGVAQQFMIKDPRLYLADPDTILQCIREEARGERVYLCGHNPGISECAALLSKDYENRFVGDLPTLGIARFSFGEAGDSRSWTNIEWSSCGLVDVYAPKLLA